MLDLPTIITFLVYFSAIIAVGIAANRVTKNLSDFVLGGRSLSGAIAAMGVGASDMSGWLLLGLPGAIYASGIRGIWLPIGLSIGAYFNWQFIAKRLRVYTEVAKDSLTIPAYFDNRFHDDSKLLRIVTATAVLVFFTFYAASGFVSGAVLFQTSFNLDYHLSLWIGAIVIIGYTSIGGFLAVNWTDFFQGSLMFLALMVVPISAFYHLDGWQHLFETVKHIDIHYVDAFSGVSIISIISLLSWGLGYFGQPHILVRFMATRDPSEIPKARCICMTWMVFSLYGAIFTGFIGIAYFAKQPLSNPETVFLEFTRQLFNPWIAGILLGAVLSAIMSTIAAQLLASASALSEDFYNTFIRTNASNKELVIVSRLTVLIVALLAVFLAQNPKSSVLQLVGYAWAGLGAAFGPVILLSLFWKRMTRNAAIAGVITGGIIVIIWQQLSEIAKGKNSELGDLLLSLYDYSSHASHETLTAIGHYFMAHSEVFKLYPLVPGFIASLLAIVITTYLTEKPSKAIYQEFLKFEEALNS